jgi:hypothetical protein
MIRMNKKKLDVKNNILNNNDQQKSNKGEIISKLGLVTK